MPRLLFFKATFKIPKNPFFFPKLEFLLFALTSVQTIQLISFPAYFFAKAFLLFCKVL